MPAEHSTPEQGGAESGADGDAEGEGMEVGDEPSGAATRADEGDGGDEAVEGSEQFSGLGPYPIGLDAPLTLGSVGSEGVRSAFPAGHSRCSDRRSLLSLVSIESDEPSGKTKRGSMASVTSVASEPRPRFARASTSSLGSEDGLDDQMVSLVEFRDAMSTVKPEVRRRVGSPRVARDA